jgi:hypothetical protein
MAQCSPLGEAAAGMTEVENIDEAVVDEDINSLATIIPSVEILGTITRSRA